MKQPTIQCINCRKQRRCLLICAYVPVPESEIDHHNLVASVVGFDESLRIAICRECLNGPLNTLGSFIAEEAR